mgnify:FL=1
MNSLLFKILYPFVWLFMKIFYPFEIIGEEKLSKQDKIIIYANHISFLDPINLIILAHRNKKVLNFMAKDELFKNALFSWFLKKMGAFSVKRGDGAASLKKAADILEEGKTFCIFPEGTRSKNGQLGRPKSGISFLMCEMGVPAQPVAIVTKGQKMKAFQKTKIVVCDRITLDGQTIEMSDRRALRDLSAKLFEPIAQAIEQNK